MSDRVRFNGMRKPRSHVVWFKHFGQWPTMEIDHRNGDHSDNRIENLRLATRSQNNFNRRAWNNTSGEKNVVLDKTNHRWQVKVKAGATLVHANASHKISAILAARLIRRVLHGSFAIENRTPVKKIPQIGGNENQ